MKFWINLRAQRSERGFPCVAAAWESYKSRQHIIHTGSLRFPVETKRGTVVADVLHSSKSQLWTDNYRTPRPLLFLSVDVLILGSRDLIIHEHYYDYFSELRELNVITWISVRSISGVWHYTKYFAGSAIFPVFCSLNHKARLNALHKKYQFTERWESIKLHINTFLLVRCISFYRSVQMVD